MLRGVSRQARCTRHDHRTAQQAWWVCNVVRERGRRVRLRRLTARDGGAIHNDCGAEFAAELRCDSCDDVIDAREVDIESVERASSSLISRDRHRSPDLNGLAGSTPDGLSAALAVIGDRWTSLVVRELFLGTRRFEIFSERLGIASNILSDRLRRLVDKGVVQKMPYQQRPLRHEYRLTDKGLALYPIPLSMLAWGDRWLSQGAQAMTLTHRPCSSPLNPILCCRNCTQPATTTDIIFHTGPHRLR